MTSTFTTARSSVTTGVVTNTPQCAARSGPLSTSHTWRYSPLPGYQRDESGGFSRRTASTFSPVRASGVRSSRYDEYP